MRLTLGLIFAAWVTSYATTAHAVSCNANRCFVNCGPGQTGCGCIYDHETDECLCWCEGGKSMTGRNLTLDFKSTNWDTVRQQRTVKDVLEKVLRTDVIQCIGKIRGGLTVSLRAANPADATREFQRLCK